MIKVCVFLGSRANYSSIKSFMLELKKSKKFKLQVVCFASTLLDRYGAVIDLIKKDGFKVDYEIFSIIEGENLVTMAKSTGLALIEIPTVLEKLKPNYVLTVGDRYETMSTAISSAYLNIPIIHTMGGELSGSIDESIRHSISKLSNIHFVSTSLSKKRLIQMGEDPKNVHHVGCPRIDLVKNTLSKKINLKKLNYLMNYEYSKVGSVIDLNMPFIIISFHPVTTEYKKTKTSINKILNSIKDFDIQKIVLWPNSDAGSAEISRAYRIFREKKIDSKITIYKNLPIDIYIRLMQICSCLIGNSSSGVREGAFIGAPCLNIGNRQQFREKYRNVIDCKEDELDIYNKLNFIINNKKRYKSNLYGDGNAAKKMIKILHNYQNFSSIKKWH